ncbi:MotA/TolQ/ExbB proton channel family protein [bacterium]|nr:MotA/TolQ/ExbB proton channel family protein [bacterium]
MDTMGSAPSWLWLTHWGARLVLLILVGLSVASVAVILDRRRFYRANAPSPEALQGAADLIRKGDWGALSKLATNASSVGIFYGYLTLLVTRLSSEGVLSIDRATRSYLSEKRIELEKGLTLLATVGSNAPFIGLFGTVLGIIQAFGELSSSRGAGTGSVMGAISEALIATAVGLLVAIPAVVAFNGFQKRVKEILTACEILRDELVAKRESKG